MLPFLFLSRNVTRCLSLNTLKSFFLFLKSHVTRLHIFLNMRVLILSIGQSTFVFGMMFCHCCLASTYGLWVTDRPKLGSDKLARQLLKFYCASDKEAHRLAIWQEDFVTTFIDNSMKTCGFIVFLARGRKDPCKNDLGHQVSGGQKTSWDTCPFKGAKNEEFSLDLGG